MNLSPLNSADPPRASDAVLPLLLLTVGLFSTFYPTFLSGFTQVQQDLGDPRLINYLLEHGFRWAHGWTLRDSLWSPPFYFPAPNVGALHDTLIGMGPLYWPWRWVGAQPDTAYQLFVLSVSIANFAAAYAFLKHAVELGATASGAGAFLLAFANARTARVLHPQLMASYLTVLAVLALVLAFRAREPARRRQWIAAFFLLWVAQMWSGFYWAWFLVFSVCLALLWAGVERSRRRATARFLEENRGWILLCGVVAAALTAPMVFRHLQAAGDVGFHDFTADVLPRTARLASWLYMGTPNLLYGLMQEGAVFRSLSIPVEQQLASGLITTVGAVWGLWHYRARTLVRLFLGVGVALVVLTTALPNDFTLWRWVYEVVPGAGAIRAPARSAVVLLLPLAVGFALALTTLERRGRHLLAALLLGICVVEQVRFQPSYDKAEARTSVDAIVSLVPEGCDAFYVTVAPGSTDPLPYNPWKYHLDAMWAQLAVGAPTVNGYSGFQAAGWLPLYDNVVREQADHDRIERALTSWLGGRSLGPGCVVEVAVP